MTEPRGSNLPRPPANVAAYVEILGTDLAIDFFLAFGGAELHHADNPKGGSRLAKVLGLPNARKLAAASAAFKTRVPIPRAWIAQTLAAKGLPVAEIARTLHVTDVTVRKYVNGPKPVLSDPRQHSLF